MRMRSWWVGAMALVGCRGGETIEATRQAFLVGPPTAVINENFSTPSATFSVVAGGTWQVANGEYELRSPASGFPNGDLAVAAPMVQGDFNLQVVARALAGPGWNDFSIVFAYHSPGDYYFASFNEGDDNETNGFFRWQNGVLTKLADFPKLSTPGAFQTVTLIRNDHTIIYADDSGVVATATTPGLGDGQIGLGSRNDACDFTSVYLTTPAARSQPYPVAITAPAPGSRLRGFAALTATSAQAASVQFMDGALMPVATSAPLTAELDTIRFPYLDANHLVVSAQATSSSGQISQSNDVDYFIDNDCVHLNTGQTYSAPLGPYTTAFHVDWIFTVDDAQADAGFVLSQGPASYFSQASAIVRCNLDNQIDARNGAVYAAVEPHPCRGGEGYLFHMDVDMARKTYSVVGRQANGPWFTVARDFAFRTGREVGTIDHWGSLNDPDSGGAESRACNVSAGQ